MEYAWIYSKIESSILIISQNSTHGSNIINISYTPNKNCNAPFNNVFQRLLLAAEKRFEQFPLLQRKLSLQNIEHDMFN